MDKQIMSDDEYGKKWAELGPIEIRMIEKTGQCKHEIGEVFRYDNPYKRPEGVCHALLHVLELYIWRASKGFPLWEDDDRNVFRIHCPSKTGTVWEIRRGG